MWQPMDSIFDSQTAKSHNKQQPDSSELTTNFTLQMNYFEE